MTKRSADDMSMDVDMDNGGESEDRAPKLAQLGHTCSLCQASDYLQ